MKKLILAEFLILGAGTIFAWTNFFIELAAWLKGKACITGCAVGVVNPFLTPCFWGACFFLVAFFVSFIILTKSNNN